MKKRAMLEQAENLGVNYGELALDAISGVSGIAKDIPVIGTAVSLFKAGKSFKDYLLMGKLSTFLEELEDQESIEEFVEKLSKDEHANELGQKIMLLLDSVYDEKKPILIARAFKGYLKGWINKPTLVKIFHSISLIDIPELEELDSVYGDDDLLKRMEKYDIFLPQSEELQHLALCGLMAFEFGHSDLHKDNEGAKGGFTTNYLGQIFYDVVIKTTQSSAFSPGLYVRTHEVL